VERRARVSETYSSRFRLYMEPERVVSIGKNPVRAAMVHVEVVVIVAVSADVEVAVIIVVPAIWVSVTVVESVMATESRRRGYLPSILFMEAVAAYCWLGFSGGICERGTVGHDGGDCRRGDVDGLPCW
jgi:hypothetical protein